MPTIKEIPKKIKDSFFYKLMRFNYDDLIDYLLKNQEANKALLKSLDYKTD